MPRKRKVKQVEEKDFQDEEDDSKSFDPSDDHFAIRAVNLSNVEQSVKIPFKYEGTLPSPPLRLPIIAPSGSGKTTLLLNLINEPGSDGKNHFYKDYFDDRVTIMSPSLCFDDLFKTLPDKVLRRCWYSYSENVLQDLWDEAKSDVTMNGKHAGNTQLFVLDDLAQEIYQGGQHSVPGSMFMSVRHVNASIIVTTQKYTKLPPAIRTNNTGLIIFEIHNHKELTSIWDEHGGMLTKPEFFFMCKRMIWNTPYSFLYIDLATATKPTERFRKNFDKAFDLDEIRSAFAESKTRKRKGRSSRVSHDKEADLILNPPSKRQRQNMNDDEQVDNAENTDDPDPE